jgi:hypothetical protein
MFFLCHPEATCLSSPKDLGAPRESTAFFAVEQTARLAHILYQGGQNSAKQGRTRAIRAVYRAFGSVFHRLLVFSSKIPRTLLVPPLSTTLYHDLTRKSFIVKQKLDGRTPTPALIPENTEACG